MDRRLILRFSQLSCKKIVSKLPWVISDGFMSQLGLLLLLTFHSNRLHTRTVYTVGKTPSKYALLCAIMIDSRQTLIGEGRGFGRRRRVLE